MNKLSILTIATLASIAFVSAEETKVKKPVQVRPVAVKQMIKQEGRDVVMPVMRTGNPEIDAQIKALNTEMEAKIKAIRDDYALKLKSIIDTARASSTASTTPRFLRDDMPGLRKGMDEGRKMGVPFRENASSTASSTASTTRPMVRGVYVENQAPARGGVMNFLRGIFGGNR